MRKAFLFVLYFFFACVAAQECAFPLTASGECSGTFPLNFAVDNEDILIEVTVSQNSGSDIKITYDLGDLTLDRAADGSFLISSPIVNAFAGESPASTRHFILSVLMCLMFLALREKRGALVLVIALCAVAAPSVLAAGGVVKIEVSVPVGYDGLRFSPSQNYIISIADELKGKYALVPCNLVDDGCLVLTAKLSCVPGTYVDRSETFATCKGCTPVANALSPLLVTCTTNANSRTTGCLPGYFWNKTGAADVCTVCPNGGANYACATGFYKTGTACTGFSSSSTQICTACSAPCVNPGFYTVSPCTATADRVCGTCAPVDNCADAAPSCTSATNSQCSACKAGYWKDLSLGATRCKACMNGGASYTCPAGSWKVAFCTGTTTVDVQVCSPCRAGCGDGFRQTAPCTASADRQCAPCTTNCNVCTTATDCTACLGGFFYDTPSKTCKACAAPCASNQVETTACTSTSNRVCATCPANCATCTSATVCTSCKPGWSGANCDSTCSAASIPGCAGVTCNTPTIGVNRCTGGCTVVPNALGNLLVPGTPTTSDTCNTPCMANCAKCTTSGSCDLCQTGFFYTATASGASTFACKACSSATCTTGSFLAKACSHGSDNLCLTCSTCDGPTGPGMGGFYASSPCTATTDTVCTSCDKCTSGFFQTTECQATGLQTQNRVCKPCKLSTSCAAGQYAAPCTATADLVCQDCAVCATNFWESTACQAGGVATQNRVCSPCSTTCAIGSYQKTACTATADRVCATCTSCVVPTAGSNTDGSYETTACQANGVVTQNRVCTACTACTALQYRTVQCQASGVTTNRVCAVCKACAVGEYQSSACTATANRVCTSCTASSLCASPPAAPNGGAYQTQACSETQPQVCLACRKCVYNDYTNPEAPNGYYYEKTPCNGAALTTDPMYDITQNRVCLPCTKCAVGTWQSTGCQGGDGLSYTTNAACSDCLMNCQECTTGTTCTTCKPGFYKVVGTAPAPDACNACATCSGSTPYVSTPCSGTTPTGCTGCHSSCLTCSGPTATDCTSCTTPGYYLSGGSCLPCGTCPGSFVSSACTSTANTVCTGCQVSNCATCGTDQFTCTTCNTNYYLENSSTCTACTCAPGNYKTGGCVQTSNTPATCAPCTTCTPAASTGGFYYSTPCQHNGDITVNAACTACTECTAGSNFPKSGADCQNVPGTTVQTQDRTCSACTACSATQYQMTACTLSADTVCADCAATCTSGNYEATPCGPQLSTNRVCKRCTANGVAGTTITCDQCPSNQCNVCVAAHYLLQANECSPCTVCGAETFEIPSTGYGVVNYPAGTVPATGLTPAVNYPAGITAGPIPTGNYGCETGVHSAPAFYSSADGPVLGQFPFLGRSKYDRICVSCKKCSGAKFEVSPCTPISDRVCNDCNLAHCDACVALSTCTTCSSGYFYVADNTVSPTAYRCEACAFPGGCPSGYVETTPCTHDTNRVCTPCTQNCDTCEGPGAACTACASAYYLNTDRTCTACPVGCASCLPPASGTPTPAPQCGTCKPGFALASAGGSCLPCPTGCPSACVSGSSGPVCPP